MTTGSFPEISLTAISGSAVSVGRNTERKSPLADSINSDPNWDSLESQIDSVETNALLLESTPGSASGSFAEIALDVISGSATGKATVTGSFSEINLSSPDGLATGKASATDLEFDTVEEAQGFLGFLTEAVWAVPENSPGLSGRPEAKVLETVVLT